MAETSLEEGLVKLGRHAVSARIFIGVFVIAFGLVIACEGARLGGVLRLGEPGPLVLPAALIYLGSSIAFLLSVVFVCRWVYRAHANLFAAGMDGLEYTPGWSVGWFFVPIANLFKPFQAMRELWTTSHLAADSFAADAPSELTAWWGSFIVGNMLMNLSGRFDTFDGSDFSSGGIVLNIVGVAVVIASALLLLRIIDRVTAAQTSLLGVNAAFA